jgi:hypothetical protein
LLRFNTARKIKVFLKFRSFAAAGIGRNLVRNPPRARIVSREP